MPFSSNFTRVARGTDDEGKDVLFVEGKTVDARDVMTAMYVNLADRTAVRRTSPGAGVIALPSPDELRAVPVENALGAVDWVATLSEEPIPAVGEWVVVIGLAERDDDGPAFLWVETLQVSEQGAGALRAA